MSVEVKFFANFREIVGERKVSAEVDTIEELLEKLGQKHEELVEVFFEEGSRKLRGSVNILVNGRSVETLDGTDTGLVNGDSIAIFPPVSGG